MGVFKQQKKEPPGWQQTTQLGWQVSWRQTKKGGKRKESLVFKCNFCSLCSHHNKTNLQIRISYHASAPWHFPSRLNKDKNSSYPRGGGAGRKIKEHNPPNFSLPKEYSTPSFLHPILPTCQRSSMQLLTWVCPHSPWECVVAAKSLQSCPTLCDPIDGGPPGSPVPGILQARVVECGAIAFSTWECTIT